MRTELPPIIDDSWFLSKEYDALAMAAERKATRRPSERAMSRTRAFGKRRPSRLPYILGAVALLLFAAMVIGEAIGAASQGII